MTMIPAGYLYKRVAARPDWLKAPGVSDIYSVSSCIAGAFTHYIQGALAAAVFDNSEPGPLRICSVYTVD